ncbi:50S ribosomal protein L29 [Brachybacterium sp. p3-SID1565]|uniref:Large ribosomal subunit protein uL29 n=1 Tax=Brachybacterium epidermidis TaxID=2781983 RepID=A0ABR9VX05_9MICO|nr:MULTISPECIES: 50S ribosomal protein L29 [Brachybacterium]MBE9402726.1 50S ribosomal protein L29 [Brachybacterium epidermidis]MCT1386581.1 50S ribosomal protein L29 [Brachybacterium sp. p3-SID1565]MCT1776816.1 50S ribosomal protein L29 [Brachybacterium sp. p3-SID957]
MAATKLTADALDKLDDAKLAEELAKAKDELFKLRFQSATGQLESSGRLRSVKKDIARIYTILRERELGIRQAPGAAE